MNNPCASWSALGGLVTHRTWQAMVLAANHVLADGTLLDVTTVIWCTGFEQHFEWIDLPVFDEQGWPREYRGVVDEAPRLIFCGLVFQYAFSSMVLPGVGRDAAYVAGRVADRGRDRVAA
jgi:putative flavoprotein involved in K+ transport